MLSLETKRKIDNARDVLVGKIPNPQAQIEQITTALIYKFMDDMDEKSKTLGGKARFFVGEYEKYSWRTLLDPRIGGQERMNLYSEAVQRLSQNAKLPQIFRDVFKDAFVPYRDPETLSLFLKEINWFDYHHSEELGNAYEYLLSIMSSQGDAGQFRTPRHIIDFIVEAVDPQKDETILDPACGTAGFLISAYKHIIGANDGLDDVTGLPTEQEDRLKPEERAKLLKNFHGYDIDPGMVRLSLVNMYLHGFVMPNIEEYDSLTYEDRWNDDFDVILANPPFMTPKGGVRPHKRFQIQANRAEVLFVDYIAEHLKPQGRAGIVVPEGIIFQSGNAYKSLRKMLIEEQGLWAVVSLPAGVFQPYSGVKTSILILDKSRAKQTDEILFIDVEHDGFSLGAQRTPTKKNDFPISLSVISNWKLGKKIEANQAHWVKKDTISASGEYGLSGTRYINVEDIRTSDWEMVELGDLLDYEQPTKYIVESTEYNDSYNTPVLTAGKSFLLGYTKETSGIYNQPLPVIIFDDFTTASKLVDFPFKVKSSAMKILKPKNLDVDARYVYYMMQRLNFKPIEHKRFWISEFSKRKIPLPPIAKQRDIVMELNRYQKVIDGAQQVIDHWKPSFTQNAHWKKVYLSEIATIQSGGTPSKAKAEYWENGTIPWAGSSVCKDKEIDEISKFITESGLANSSAKLLPAQSTLIALVGATIGKTGYLNVPSTTNQNIAGLIPNDKVNPKFLFYACQTLYPRFMSIGQGKFTMANLSFVRSLQIPLPDLETQQSIIDAIEQEKKVVYSNIKLIETMKSNIKNRVQEVWGE